MFGKHVTAPECRAGGGVVGGEAEVEAEDISPKEVLIGGDTDGNRSARGSVRERHTVKTFSEVTLSKKLLMVSC